MCFNFQFDFQPIDLAHIHTHLAGGTTADPPTSLSVSGGWKAEGGLGPDEVRGAAWQAAHTEQQNLLLREQQLMLSLSRRYSNGRSCSGLSRKGEEKKERRKWDKVFAPIKHHPKARVSAEAKAKLDGHLADTGKKAAKQTVGEAAAEAIQEQTDAEGAAAQVQAEAQAGDAAQMSGEDALDAAQAPADEQTSSPRPPDPGLSSRLLSRPIQGPSFSPFIGHLMPTDASTGQQILHAQQAARMEEWMQQRQQKQQLQDGRGASAVRMSQRLSRKPASEQQGSGQKTPHALAASDRALQAMAQGIVAHQISSSKSPSFIVLPAATKSYRNAF